MCNNLKRINPIRLIVICKNSKLFQNNKKYPLTISLIKKSFCDSRIVFNASIT